MADLSNYLEDKLVDHVIKGTSFTAPSDCFLALYTAVTDAEAGTGTEVSGGAYARVSVRSAMSASSGGASSNASAVEFATATGNWGTITHAALRDASTGGNALTAIKALAASRTVNTGDILRFPIGDIDFSIA